MMGPANGGAVEFRVLGPFEVIHNGERLTLGGPRQRTVLAALVI
jgi:DNA-binding SARP family transcriptional activator